LAITTFSLSLLGTFIVRSGVLTSVHAFVTDPQRGIFILQFLSIVVGGALLLYGLRAPSLGLPKVNKLKLVSQESAILANNLLLLVAAGTVLLGTLYPLIYDVIFAQKISVGYPYFNAVFIPIFILLLLVLVPTILPAPRLLLLSAGLSVIAAVIFLSLGFKLVAMNALIGLSFALTIIVSTVIAWFRAKKSKKLAMSIAHIGLAISIIGISITPAYEIEKDLRMQVGDSIKIADYSVKFNSVEVVEGPNYLAQQGFFSVVSGSHALAKLYPEKRLYLAQELPMTETAILPGILQDIYIALGQQFTTEVWSVRIYYKPFVRWIWLGALLMALGALCQIVGGKKFK
jgi:cytochrome c-type biogenesis protein CcmF